MAAKASEKTRRITLRCIKRNLYLDLPPKAQITISPTIPATVRIYADKQMKQPVAMFSGVMALYESEYKPSIMNTTEDETEETHATLSNRQAYSSMKGWKI